MEKVEISRNVSFATGKDVEAAISILKSCLTQFEILVDIGSEHATVVNVVTFEAEQQLVGRFMKSLEEIRQRNS